MSFKGFKQFALTVLIAIVFVFVTKQLTMSFDMFKLLMGGIAVTLGLLVIAQQVSTFRYNRAYKKKSQSGLER